MSKERAGFGMWQAWFLIPGLTLAALLRDFASMFSHVQNGVRGSQEFIQHILYSLLIVHCNYIKWIIKERSSQDVVALRGGFRAHA